MDVQQVDHELDNSQALLAEALAEVGSISSLEELEPVRVKWLGRRGRLRQLTSELGPLIRLLGAFDPDRQRRDTGRNSVCGAGTPGVEHEPFC